MSLKPIRQYFKDRFTAMDSQYVEHTDAFNTENIDGLNLDKAYHIFYGSAQTSSLNHLTTKDNVSTTVSIFSKGYRDPIEALDDAMDFANHFRLECMNPKLATTGQFIKNVVCTSIEASPINTQNDNSIVVRLQFNVTVIFGIGINLNCEC
jgi:hypothetical protein